MAFEIRIKPLVLFDLEDRIEQSEQETTGTGVLLYQNFLSGLNDLQNHNTQSGNVVYETVQKYAMQHASCSLFYMITGNIILVMGLL